MYSGSSACKLNHYSTDAGCSEVVWQKYHVPLEEEINPLKIILMSPSDVKPGVEVFHINFPYQIAFEANCFVNIGLASNKYARCLYSILLLLFY